jgi:hypothetical protein
MTRLFPSRHHSGRAHGSGRHGRPARRPLVMGVTIAVIMVLLAELAAIVLTRH